MQITVVRPTVSITDGWRVRTLRRARRDLTCRVAIWREEDAAAEAAAFNVNEGGEERASPRQMRDMHGADRQRTRAAIRSASGTMPEMMPIMYTAALMATRPTAMMQIRNAHASTTDAAPMPQINLDSSRLMGVVCVACPPPSGKVLSRGSWLQRRQRIICGTDLVADVERVPREAAQQGAVAGENDHAGGRSLLDGAPKEDNVASLERVVARGVDGAREQLRHTGQRRHFDPAP